MIEQMSDKQIADFIRNTQSCLDLGSPSSDKDMLTAIIAATIHWVMLLRQSGGYEGQEKFNFGNDDKQVGLVFRLATDADLNNGPPIGYKTDFFNIRPKEKMARLDLLKGMIEEWEDKQALLDGEDGFIDDSYTDGIREEQSIIEHNIVRYSQNLFSISPKL